MPRIPIYQGRMNLPAIGPGVKASMAVATLPGRAIERAGAEIGRFADALHRAEQVKQMSRLQVEAQKSLQELQDSFSQRTDPENFEPEAQAAIREIKNNLFSQVKDPEVKRTFAPQFDQLALRVQTNIRHKAQKLRVEHAQAETLKNIDALTKSYEQADETDKPRILGQITGTIQAGAVAGLWTEPDALKMIQSKVKQLEYGDARADLDRDPDHFNPDKYRHLDEKTRIDLKHKAETLASVRLSQTLSLIRFQQQQEDRRAKELRDAILNDLTIKGHKGQLKPAEVFYWADRRIIHAADINILMGLINKAEKGKDDPWTKLYLTDQMLQGRPVRPLVWEAFNEGMLSADGAIDMLEKAHQVSTEQPDIMKSPEYKLALDYIKTITNPPRSLTEHPDYASALREQYAKEEFYRRVVIEGQKIPDVVRDIEQRYVKRPVPPTALPRPMFGNRTNPGDAYRKTVEAYKSGRINRKTYDREIQLIYKLDQALEEQVQQVQESPTRPSVSVKESIKERKRSW